MNMQDKICLVTGATDGIGLESAKVLAQQGAEVIVHGRNAEKGQKAIDQIKQLSGNDQVWFVQADFSSFSEVKKMAEELNNTLPRLDILINNAGTASTATHEKSKDGLELTFAVNHLSPFLLTHLLMNKLRASPQARIINVSSVAHKFKPLLDMDDLMSEKVKAINAYGRSKFANILFSNSLARLLEGTEITSNALHPGTIRSNFGKQATITRLFYKFAGPFLKTSSQGAQTILYLSTSDEVKKKSGGYYIDSKLAEPDPATNNTALADALWAESVKLVGV